MATRPVIRWTDGETACALDWLSRHWGHVLVMLAEHNPERGRRALRCDTCRQTFQQTCSMTRGVRSRVARRAATP